jgi:superfamily I DNA/RNA helicase
MLHHESYQRRRIRGSMDAITWDASQLRALAREGTGPVLVRGKAGSGRTAVAIGHALHLVRQQTITGHRILFVTPFKPAAEAAAVEIAKHAGDAASQIAVVSFADLCRGLLEKSGARLTPAPDEVRAGFLADAIAVLKRRAPRAVLGRSPVFFSEEISEVIKGRALGRREEYLELEREGRWRGLEQTVRQTVWEVYEEYETRLAGAGLHDPDDLALRALKLEATTASDGGFDEVIVDDAHGLSRAALLFLGRLATPSDRMFVLIDEDQRYHRQGFSLKDAGVEPRRSVELTGAWRPGPEIRAFAETILNGETLSDAERAAAPASGPIAIVEAGSYAAQFEIMARRVQDELERNPADPVAVLTATARDALVARRAFAAADSNLAQDLARVRFLTMDEARGLEFSSVILVGVNEGVLPVDEAGHDLTGKFRDRRRLYVAATRARNRLTILCQSGLRSSFLPP